MPKIFDLYFILGQGPAGTCLAFRFLEEGIPFMIFDNHHESSSAMVAAGLWNPIVFKRITTSWLADAVIDEMENFYPKTEALTGGKYFFPGFNIRLHSSAHERHEWEEKQDLPRFEKYLDTPSYLDIPQTIDPDYGFGKVNHTGYLNLPEFLKISRDYFEKEGVLQNIKIDLPDTKDEVENFHFDGVKPLKIIDCRGSVAAYSKWWKYLPFKLSKGESLVVKCPGLNLEHTLNAGVFVMPLGDDMYKIGSTYAWDKLDTIPTEEARNELIEKFKKITGHPFEVVSHSAGVRPTVSDRRPLVGRHPDVENLIILNGLGTKGVMLAPYFSRELISHLLHGTSIHPEANIDRFKKRIKDRI